MNTLSIRTPTIEVLLCLVLLATTDAQQSAASGSLGQTPPSSQLVAGDPEKATARNLTSIPAQDSGYRIGPGDVLDIRVWKSPELSEIVRVDQRGTIDIPMVEERLSAACLSEADLAKEIALRYSKYKRNPQVDVFVKEFQSQVVSVVGAVTSPAQFRLQRPVRLVELLTLAGGPAPRAGRTIQVVHASGSPACGGRSEESGESGLARSLDVYQLNDTLRGDPVANPIVQGGDIIAVQEADQVYVVGNVVQPKAIPLKEPITVSRAIAMAGGVAQGTNKSHVRIVRQGTNAVTKQEIYVSLSAIENKRSEDIVLLANDIVDVPSSTGKAVLRTMLGVASQLPLRVVP